MRVTVELPAGDGGGPPAPVYAFTKTPCDDSAAAGLAFEVAIGDCISGDCPSMRVSNVVGPVAASLTSG